MCSQISIQKAANNTNNAAAWACYPAPREIPREGGAACGFAHSFDVGDGSDSAVCDSARRFFAEWGFVL